MYSVCRLLDIELIRPHLLRVVLPDSQCVVEGLFHFLVCRGIGFKLAKTDAQRRRLGKVW